MKYAGLTLLVALLAACFLQAQKSSSTPFLFSNQRLKTHLLDGSTMVGDNYERLASGLWVSESKDPSKALAFPMQVKIICTHRDEKCKELSVTLAPVPNFVMVQEVDETEY